MHCVPKIIKLEILDSVVVALVKVDILGSTNVIELSVMRRCEQFDSVSHKVSIELHEQSY
jgi:hypothetical protein